MERTKRGLERESTNVACGAGDHSLVSGETVPGHRWGS